MSPSLFIFKSLNILTTTEIISSESAAHIYTELWKINVV